ncbi:hypothetical protein H4G63_004502 [Salmonella enterica]|uniref:hypothetical protein n=1 Tax=Gammaproteobacteria TaxID=1236 RepID=UPI0009ABE041|nr:MULTISPECIES: hypothetical protein [Gammaproteobacteria]HEB4994517.1 hypothetical protein [Aeromonas hydrophila subsp. hydrophila]EFY7055459.1 hypothetical protein [Salmonella enterica]EGE9999182.1 hypothetical protein [Salmonella enterica]EGN9571831.1 hypothetical protein [Salmonella enterica]EHU3740625.1 hypothetical protein [Salmonella enterica]
MDLNTWIDSVGGIEKAAELLKEKPRTVYSWYRKEKAPRLSSSLNIVSKSRGEVDYNGIYGPLASARVAGEV